MTSRIAVPVPLSNDPVYVERSLPQYERAVEMAGGEPVLIPLDRSPAELEKLVKTCQGVLLPGSGADIDPAEYNAKRNPNTHPSDPKRQVVDWALLDDAFRLRKPVLGICYGLQSLNVYCGGSLIQHIDSSVNHAIGRKVAVAHEVEIEPNSALAALIGNQQKDASSTLAESLIVRVNSSHHQSAEVVGTGLRVVGRCPQDGIVEALEGTSPEHFVLAVQWHPERSVDWDEPSRRIFREFVEAVSRSQCDTGIPAREKQE